MILINILINYVIGLAIILAGKIFFGFEATNFSLFFIVPIGAIISGTIMGGGFARGLFKKNIKSTKRTKIINIVIGIIFFVSIHFAYYQVTYIDDNREINYHFNGEHISHFRLPDADENLNFISFTVDKINSQSITFTRRVVQEIGTVEGNKVVNWLFFAIDFLGFLLGVHIAYKIKLDDLIYCDTCKMYLKNKDILKFTKDIDENITMLKTFIDQEDEYRLDELIKENPMTSKPEGKAYVEGTLHKCDGCGKAYVTLVEYTRNDKGKYEKESDKNVKIDISKDLAKTI